MNVQKWIWVKLKFLNNVIKNLLPKQEIFLCGNYELMTNCLVSMLYNNPVSKQFVWDLCGNYMLDKLSKDNENKINIPVESEEGIEWQGVRYSIIKEELD